MAQEPRDERNRRWDEPFGNEPLDAAAVSHVLALPAFSAIDRADFPAWLPLESIIANDGRVRIYRKGDVIIRQGGYGSSLFAILEGAVVGRAVQSVGERRRLRGSRPTAETFRKTFRRLFARPRPPEHRKPRNRKVRSVRNATQVQMAERGWPRVIDVDSLAEQEAAFTLRPPQIFGELAALTRSPRSADVYALEDSIVFELRWQGLRDIRNWSAAFRTDIDRLYSERGLVTRLQECPLFDHVPPESLDEIARHSLFETYGNVDWTHRFKSEIRRRGSDTGHIIEQEPLIAEEGHHADGLLLINSGFARVSQRVDHGERTNGHLSRNDVFGLAEIAEATGSGNSPPLRSSLRAIGYVDVIRIPTNLVRQHVLPDLPREFLAARPEILAHGEQEKMRQGMMDFVVDHRFINGEAAMVINLDRCVGCDDCVRACAVAHDNNPRFVRHGYSFENAMVANACMHCTDPVCLIGCPTGAIHREEETGNVIINDNTCIGCATCANSCPYNNIRMVDIRNDEGDFLRDNDGNTISRATKCDFCAGQLTGPACAHACPHDALVRINIRDTEKLLKWLG